jgi:hypothetical protein
MGRKDAGPPRRHPTKVELRSMTLVEVARRHSVSRALMDGFDQLDTSFIGACCTRWSAYSGSA